MGGAKERAQAILERSLRTTYHEDGPNVKLHTYQDVEPHLEYAKKCRREDAERRGKFGKRQEFRRTFTLPMNVITGIAQRLGIPAGQIFDKDNWERIEKEYKTSEYAGFRTTIDKAL